MTYRKEFPDFDPATMPTLPQDFEDVSWGNDLCPSFLNEVAGLIIFVDYADPAKREYPDGRRFSLSPWDNGPAYEGVIESDDWAEIEAAVLAAAFVAQCREAFTEEQLAEIKTRNASPDYAGDVCATHDFADANMLMLEAFSATFGREPLFLTEGADAPDAAPDLALWGAAWTRAKTDHLTASPLEVMAAEFAAFTMGEDFEGEGDALELLMVADGGEIALTADQRAWLEAFVERWNAAQAAEDAAKVAA